MTTWIALLRGINVGGKNKLAMQALTQTLQTAGLQNIRTYIQSGNVVFNSSARSANSLAATIRDAIQQHHGLGVETIVLSGKQFISIARQNPYRQAQDEPKTLHVFFLAEAAAADAVARMSALTAASESVTLMNQTLYLHAPDGIGRSKLVQGMDKALAVSTTARNWKTVSSLVEMLQAD